jgi:hypothetical protein
VTELQRDLSLVLFASITAFAVALRYAERWFGARRAIGARALASKLADALRLIISRKFLHQIRSPLGAVLIKNSLCI